MRKTIIVGLVAAVGALVAAPAWATTPSNVVHVVNSPDDGTPPWARDTFTRTTTVETTSTGFTVAFVDDGSFRTPAGVTGHLHGEGSFVITGGVKKTSGLPHGTIDRTSVAVKDSFTRDWWTNFIDGGTTPGIVDWKWTYRTACETRVETPAGATGDLPSKVCPKPTVTTIRPVIPKPCEAYLYLGTRTNLCDRFPGDRAGVTCAQVGFQVQLLDKRVDPWGLDGSGGGNRGIVGIGCEGKPRKPHHTPTATPTATPTPTMSPTTTPVTFPTTPPPVVGAGGSDGGSNLPVTGPAGIVAAGAGLALLVGGGTAFFLARRRRTSFTA